MLEIVTLNAIDRRAGIGTMLIEAAVVKARRFGCHEIRLTTTNDNIDALRFYQRRGFRMAELRPGAVDQSRQRKPQIPRVGDYGIPLRDEIDLTLPRLSPPITCQHLQRRSRRRPGSVCRDESAVLSRIESSGASLALLPAGTCIDLAPPDPPVGDPPTTSLPATARATQPHDCRSRTPLR